MGLHKDVVEENLHESKGVSTAAADLVFITDGVGSGSFKTQAKPSNMVIINALADLPAPVAGVIQLVADTFYIFGAAVTTGDRFALAANVAISCGDTNGPLLDYTGSGDMFTGAGVNFTLQHAHVTCAAGTLLNLTGGLVRIDDTSIDATLQDGKLTDVVGLVVNRCSFLASTLGMQFLGTNTVQLLSINKIRYVTPSATGIHLDLASIVFNSLEILDVVYDSPAGAIGVKGIAASGNMAANKLGRIAGCEYDPDMTPLSGITRDDVRWDFRTNTVIADTMPDAMVSLNANATVTVLAVGVPTIVLGTFVDERSSHFTNTTAGRVTYVGEKPLTSPIDAILVMDPVSGTNKTIRAYIAINGTEIVNSSKAINIGSGDPKGIALMWQAELQPNDFVELFIENETDSVDVTVLSAILRVR